MKRIVLLWALVTRWGEEYGSAVLEGPIPQAESPLQAAVGAAFADGAPAPNMARDVSYVLLLLNDWRGRAGLPLIGEDGLVRSETRGANRGV